MGTVNVNANVNVNVNGCSLCKMATTATTIESTSIVRSKL
jgi:hypothetical protein